METINQQLASDSIIRKKTYGGGNKKLYITIHETGNVRAGANAEMHARLQSAGNSREASWHYQVDDKQAIQSFSHNISCWHGGDGSKGVGNLHSIAIEICVNSDGDFKQAVKNAAELTRHIMKAENIPIQNIVQHNHWSGKNCPANLRSGAKGINWNDFIQLVRATVEVKAASLPKKEETYLNFPTWQKDEMANIYKMAREKGVFSSEEHEANIKAGKMTIEQSIFLMTSIAGAALNGGVRVK